MLSDADIFNKFKINDVVEVNYALGYADRPDFFGVVTGFTLNDIDELLVSIKQIVHYQDEEVIRHVNPRSRMFSITKI